ncbi:hypothetical protein RZS28_03250 [Methylocapsa polymorpha]|uniref:J domain-containing protein n=1 Tax=Methylocapsa polymorpha TaxID=3080828 RepID=A0ABZ0HVF5_9HYPH|nr:hypothetical protein RZS28_03250 [Methylocapsa sp. RX1]
MIRTNRNKQADFADILSALGDNAGGKPSQLSGDDGNEDQEPIAPANGRKTAPHPTVRLRHVLGSVSWRWLNRLRPHPSAPAVAYAEEAAEAAEPAEANTASRPKPEPPKVQPAQTEDEAIAEELGLRADLADVDLKQIRREFAKKNHPDRFGPAQRMRAARRMSIANMLIDQHLKQKASAR